MKWQKRECPINMEIVPYGSGWEDITLDICGNHHWWSVSGCLGDGFGALVESLYALYPHQTYDEQEANRLTDVDEFVGEYENGEYKNLRPRTPEDSCYTTFPKSAEFYWDHESWGVHWKLTRESGPAREFMMAIELEESDYKGGNKKGFRYEVKYADFCYAVGKAITVAVKKHGFAGFHTSVWESDVNIRHLCFLKACGMGHPDAVQPFESAERGEGATSSFDEELELLMFDM